MIRVDCTLICDGSSDVTLIPILGWLLRQHGVLPLRPIERYDPSRFRHSPSSLGDRLKHAYDNFPCDLLFVHRDSESQSLAHRVSEIEQAIEESQLRVSVPQVPIIMVVPVRMTEAWLLFDESSIRHAAGSPNGKIALDLPSLKRCEAIPDPKRWLYDSLRTASEKSGRHLKKFNVNAAVHRVTELIVDFSPLRTLSAFQHLERSLVAAISQGWGSDR